jgi:hypothetical protein
VVSQNEKEFVYKELNIYSTIKFNVTHDDGRRRRVSLGGFTK